MSRGTLDPAAPVRLSPTGLSPSSAGFPKTVWLGSLVASAVRTPGRSRPGLGSFHFARRYSGNHCCFLFLRLLRCFSSPGSPRPAMDSPGGGRGFLGRVSPFRHLRVAGHLLLPEAFRSLSRLSSALSAKASTMRSLQHNQHASGNGIPQGLRVHSVARVGNSSFLAFFSVCFSSDLPRMS